ncbi:MAG: hypothetical protein MRY74_07595 [Neomegalonema sp.]|nr:hypothetical protein [Neomegalonema sp.]
MKTVAHPGPVASERLQLIPCAGQVFEARLPAGAPLDQAVADAFADAGAQSGWISFENAPVSALDYVIPAGPRDESTVAWYSETYSFPGQGRIERLGGVVGQNDGAPLLHGHGVWTPESGAAAMGHILPGATILAAPVVARCVGVTGARFERLFDPETNFTLFQPVADIASAAMDAQAANCALLRLAPNIDFSASLSAACARLGWPAARIHGLGSLVEARFDNGVRLNSPASEFLVLDAETRADGAAAAPQIAIVGVEHGRIVQGALTSGENAVLITAELVLERL